MVETVIANEILNALDSTVLSSESKNSIVVDYLRLAHKEGFVEGQKSVAIELDEKHATPVLLISELSNGIGEAKQRVG